MNRDKDSIDSVGYVYSKYFNQLGTYVNSNKISDIERFENIEKYLNEFSDHVNCLALRKNDADFLVRFARENLERNVTLNKIDELLKAYKPFLADLKDFLKGNLPEQEEIVRMIAISGRDDTAKKALATINKVLLSGIELEEIIFSLEMMAKLHARGPLK